MFIEKKLQNGNRIHIYKSYDVPIDEFTRQPKYQLKFFNSKTLVWSPTVILSEEAFEALISIKLTDFEFALAV